MLLESIKFYEHVEVLLKFKFLIQANVSKRAVETPRLIMITTYTNMTYTEITELWNRVKNSYRYHAHKRSPNVDNSPSF